MYNIYHPGSILYWCSAVFKILPIARHSGSCEMSYLQGNVPCSFYTRGLSSCAQIKYEYFTLQDLPAWCKYYQCMDILCGVVLSARSLMQQVYPAPTCDRCQDFQIE